ncbi:RNA polymerase sigma-70 factor [Tsukamurella soli]|uniref:RNA polymerase sigma-70 factor n=1 Tax=Tsukamurella soli TaxID=644556 RepID=A0ABP8K609_9ACTN
MTESAAPQAESLFVDHRPLLFSIAYEILGSVTDAEDVLQESYIRWCAVDPAEIGNPRAYLASIVTRQSLNALRAAARRREEYVGPWLPEPLATGGGPDGAAHVLAGEAVTTAMLLVLESLTPTDRAVFVLREVFDFGYSEIAAAVDKSAAAVRQINHRARGHVHARRQAAVATPDEAQAAADRFFAAVTTGDLQALMDVLAPDVVSLADGGGVVQAARRPVRGADRVARLMLGLVRTTEGALVVRPAVFNGMPAVVVDWGAVRYVLCVEVRGGSITAIYVIGNPAKVSHITGRTR